MDSCNINLNVAPSEVLGEEAIEVIRRIYNENQKMKQMVADIFEKYSSLHSQLQQHFKIIHENEINANLDPRIRKRNADHLDIIHNDINNNNNNNNSASSCIIDGNCCKRIKMINNKPKVSRVLVQVDSSNSSLVVKDGYGWRKYGQKVTRDNPSPRAYFKCSFAPLCPVKKKVQRSVEDPKVIVVTYEGEHTHKKSSSPESIATFSTKIPSHPSTLIDLSPTRSHNISSPDSLIHQNLHDNKNKEKGSEEDNVDEGRRDVQHWLVERMASFFTKDPSFTSALAAAISDKVLMEKTFC